MGTSSRRQLLLLASNCMALTRDQGIQAKLLQKSRFSQILLGGPHIGPKALLEVSSFLQHNLLIIMIDQHL